MKRLSVIMAALLVAGVFEIGIAKSGRTDNSLCILSGTIANDTVPKKKPRRNPNRPNHPRDTVNPNRPGHPRDTVIPNRPTNPTTPTNPTPPTNPTSPTNPTTPTNPANPTTPKPPVR